MHRLVAAPLVLAAILAAPAASATAEPGASFDYLYVRAHEGNASGGHAAIRFGATTFDFQHDGGWLAPRRDDSRRFQHAYRTLENRSIEVSRVAATPETVARLEAAFERRLLAQSRQFEIHRDLQRDVALLEALAAGGDVHAAVRGAGFFAASSAGGDAPPALLALRRRIEERHGPAWLALRSAAAERDLRELSLAPADVSSLRIEPLLYPIAAASSSRQVEDALAARAAVSAIAEPRPLAAGARAGATPDAASPLGDAERAGLVAARQAIEDGAVALAASRRPDWGDALLLAAARLVVLDESLAAGRLVTLDALPRDAATLPVSKRRRALLPALLAEARADLARASTRFFTSAEFREAEWSAVEAAQSRVAELHAAVAGASWMRVAAGDLMPEAVARVAVEPRPAASPAELGAALSAARATERRYREALGAAYDYDLFTRNCVSELFRTVDMALARGDGAPAPDHAAVAAESGRRLGGYVDPVARANFIPFVSSRNVRETWQVVERIHLPSARAHAVAREGTLRAALRESNVVTSTLYTPADRSGFFVFFTDGHWPLRPLLGAVNLGASLARSGVGILQLPLDRGRGLRAGLEGAVWSLPELFFANIRKGTIDYLPPEQRPPPS